MYGLSIQCYNKLHTASYNIINRNYTLRHLQGFKSILIFCSLSFITRLSIILERSSASKAQLMSYSKLKDSRFITGGSVQTQGKLVKYC